MTLQKAFQLLIGTTDESKAEGFVRFLSEKLWEMYNNYTMDKVKMADSGLVWNISIPNAKENQEYTHTVQMPEVASAMLPGVEVCIEEVKGLQESTHGLAVDVAPDRKSFTIHGTPQLDAFRKDGAVAESTFELTIRYRFKGADIPCDVPASEKKLPFVINQDPRKLWKNLPVNWDAMPEPKYHNEDAQTAYVKVESLPDGTPQKDIVAASKRGRSHAQEAKPRDDFFRVEHTGNGWYVMAVADGAGSAKFSRKGSQIACNVAVDSCKQTLEDSAALEGAIAEYSAALKTVKEEDARKAVGDFVYKTVGAAAFKAHKAINAEAATTGYAAKLYATTLLLTVCKKFSYGWFIASFWVGDGAICLYDRNAHSVKILGVPDEGEFAGQTRFLTMPEIFHDSKSFYQRLRFNLVDDFTALFLMSDGVSDPKFETDANLLNPDKWDALWDDLKANGVELTDDNEASKDQLLNWLDFWSPGNHDDRTIAILYEGDAPEAEDISADNTEGENLKETHDVADVSAEPHDEPSEAEAVTEPVASSGEAPEAEAKPLPLPDVEETIELDSDELKA